MVDCEIVPQIEFDSLEDFVKSMNNFYLYFHETSLAGSFYRQADVFKRFKCEYSDLTSQLMSEVSNYSGNKAELPYEKLFEAYKLMSKLICSKDEGAKDPDGSYCYDFLLR